MSIRRSLKFSAGAAQLITLAGILAITLLATPQSQAQGMRVTRDPITGQLRAPTAEENKALDDQRAADEARKAAATSVQIAPPSAKPTPITHPNGAVQLRLDEQSMVYSVMVRNADGSMSMQCVTGEQNAFDVVLGNSPSIATQ